MFQKKKCHFKTSCDKTDKHREFPGWRWGRERVAHHSLSCNTSSCLSSASLWMPCSRYHSLWGWTRRERNIWKKCIHIYVHIHTYIIKLVLIRMKACGKKGGMQQREREVREQLSLPWISSVPRRSICQDLIGSSNGGIHWKTFYIPKKAFHKRSHPPLLSCPPLLVWWIF